MLSLPALGGTRAPQARQRSRRAITLQSPGQRGRRQPIDPAGEVGAARPVVMPAESDGLAEGGDITPPLCIGRLDMEPGKTGVSCSATTPDHTLLCLLSRAYHF